MDENQEITEKKLSDEKSTISTQLRLKINFPNSFTHINVLQNNRIGIISYNSLIIYSLFTFREISRIIPELLKKENLDLTQNAYYLKNFIELKNKDLVLWTSRITLFYSLSGKNYKLYQTIDGSDRDKLNEEQNNYSRLSYFYFTNINETENGDLVLCSYIGIKLYTKNKDQYNFKYYYSSEYDLQNALRIKSNRLILFQSEQKVFDFLDADTFFKISIFNTSNQYEKTLTRYSVHNDLSDYFNFLINGNNLFVIYSKKLEIYDLEKNIKIFCGSIFDYFDDFLCNYDDNYFIARNNKGIIKLYKFEDNGIKSYKELEFNKFKITGIKNIKKNNFLIYNKNNIKILTIK